MNRKLIKKSILLLIVLHFFTGSQAQDKVIRGVVTTFDSIPVINAEIKIKSSNQTILTDTLGLFSATVSENDQLTVSANGFYNEKVKLDGKTKLVAVNLKMKPGEKNKQYAIGYGHVSDADRLNAVSTLQSKDMDFSYYSDMYDLIKGRFAGVQVINEEILIRGINSLNSSNAALIVIDGVPVMGNALNSLPPAEVKSINILKDGGAAIYGARGANGVVIIETKNGGGY